MTQPTFAQWRASQLAANGLNIESLQERILSAFACLASGQNPDGTAWPGLGGGGGGLLAIANYDPGAAVTQNNSTTTYAALDTTNLRATFTAPSSGIVVVEIGCFLVPNAGVQAALAFIEGATFRGGFLGQTTVVGYHFAKKRLTGVSAGSHSYDLAFASTVGATSVSVKYGGGDPEAGGFGPAHIAVYSSL